MAKRRDKMNLDLNLDLDFDKELGDIDFGQSHSKPPKNAREAVTRTMKDARIGFKDEIFGSKFKTLGDIAKASIPNSVSAEYNELASSVSDMKTLVTDSVDELRKQSGNMARALKRLAPENSKLANVLQKLGDKLDPKSSEQKELSKRELENQKIQAGILAAVGELTNKTHTDNLLQQAIQNKQHASSTEILRNIYAETKLQRVFHYEITNAYYRKSLELQYKLLFTQREALEFQKLTFMTYKNQLETIVLNTGLPEFLKARNTEALKHTLKQRSRDMFTDVIYKQFNPFGEFSKNITKALESNLKGLKEGLASGAGMFNSMADAREMAKETGMTPGKLIGMQLASFAKNQVGGRIGKFIEGTKYGKKGVFDFKNAMADPRYFLKTIMDRTSGSKGTFSSFLNKIAGFGFKYSANPNENKADYGRGNLDDAAAFDGRAHSSITKVIPGLLSKIYAEIKTTRMGLKIAGDSSIHELVFDNKSDRFMTKKEIKRDIKNDVRKAMKNNVKPSMNNLSSDLKEMGVGLSGGQLASFNNALISYMLQPGSAISPGILLDPDFINTIQDEKVRSILFKNRGKMKSAMMSNSFLMDSISYSLSNIRSSLPSMHKRYEDLYKSGHGDIMTSMGVATMGADGSLMHNSAGANSLIMGNMGTFNRIAKTGSSDEGLNTNSNLPGMDGIVGGMKAQISGSKKKVKKALKSVDSNTLVDYFSSSKSTIEEFAKQESKAMLNKIKPRFNKVKKEYNTFIELSKKEMSNSQDPNRTEKIKEYIKGIKASMGNFLKSLQHEGHNMALQRKIEEKIKQAKRDIKKKEIPLSKSVTDKISQDSFNSPINSIKDAYSSAGGVQGMMNTAREVISDPLKTYEFIKKGGQKLKALFGGRSLEELKAEYWQSPERKSGEAPDFMGWVDAMGYKIKPNSLNDIFKITRQWDKRIAKGLLTMPFTAIKTGFSGLFGFGKSKSKAVNAVRGARNLTGSAIGKTANFMLDTLPFGMGEIIKAPFALMNKTLEVVGLKQSENKKKDDKERKGSWLNRLNIFRKDKSIKGEDKRSFGQKVGDFIKNNKGKLTVMAVLTGIMGITSAMGVTLQDVFGAVKKVGGAILTVGKTIGKFVGKVAGFFGFGKEQKKDENGNLMYDENGEPIYDEDSNSIGTGAQIAATAGLAGAGLYALRHPIKAAGKLWGAAKSMFKGGRALVNGTALDGAKNLATKTIDKVKGFGTKIIEAVVKFFKSKFGFGWLGDKIASIGAKIAPKIDKTAGNISQMKSKLVKLKSACTNKNVQKKVGKKVLTKVAAKIGGMIAAAATGIGAILTGGMILWELGWALWYMYDKDMGFFQALGYQLFGIDVFQEMEMNEEASKEKTVEQIQAESSSEQITEQAKEEEKKEELTTLQKAYVGAVTGAKKVGSAIASGVSTAYNTVKDVVKTAYEKGKGFLKSNPLTKNKFPKESPSPYLEPEKQQSMGGTRANINGASSTLVDRLSAFARHYYDITGKPLPITAAHRPFQQQVKLWEAEAKVKYTGNKQADIEALQRAGGKMFGINGGNVGYPSPHNQHVKGNAIDINISKTPFDKEVDAEKRHWLFDDILEKYGLKRPFTAFNNPGGSHKERWHVQLGNQPTVALNDATEEAPEAPAGEKGLWTQAVEYKNSVMSSVEKAQASNSSSLVASNASSNSIAQTVASTSSASSTSATPSYGLGSGSIEDVLTKQLQVQTRSMEYLKEIRDVFVSGVTPSGESVGGSMPTLPSPNNFPESVVDLSRKENFANV